MRTPLASWTSPLLLLACSADAPPPHHPEPAPMVSTASAAPAPVPPPEPAVRLPPEVAAAARPVCEYETNAGDVSAVDLYVPGSETRWATVLGGTIRTALPKSDEGQPILTVATPGTRVRAEGRLGAIPFQLTRPRVFAGIAVPNADHVAVAAVTASGLTLSVQKPEHLTSTARLQEAVSCADVMIGRASWSPAAVLPDTSSAKRGLLVTGLKIPVRATEDGPPVAELSFPKRKPLEPGGWQAVSVVATSNSSGSAAGGRRSGENSSGSAAGGRRLGGGSSSRIVFAESWGTVFGWVPTSAVTSVPPPTRGARQAALREAAEFGTIGLLSTTLTPPSDPPPPRDRVTCEHEVPLIVEVSGRQVTVGAILAGVTMEVGAAQGETARLFSAPPGLNPIDTARLLVSRPALEGCRRAPVIDPPDSPPDEE